MSSKLIDFAVDEYELLPYQALNHVGIVKCFRVDSIRYDSKVLKDIYLGIMDNGIRLDGIDFLLNQEMMEG